MGYRNSDDRDGIRNRGSDSEAAPLTADDARRQYENAMKGGGLQNISVQKDKDGNSRVLGFKIPKELLPAVETVLPNAILWLQRTGSKFSYDKALWLANKVKFKDQKAQAIAKAAEFGVRWGLIGIKPITDAVSNSKTYARERKELFKEFKPVIDATGVDYKTNEVIRNAFDELHDDMVTNMKLLAADALTLAPIIYVGVRDQKAQAQKRKSAPTHGGDIAEQVRAEIDAINTENKYRIERDRQLTEARNQFVAEQAGKLHGPDGKPLDAEALGEWFDRKFEERERERRYRERYQDGRTSDDQESKKKGDITGEQLSILGLSLGSQIIKTNIRDAANRRSKSINAWKMIQHLKEEMDEQTSTRSDKRDGYDSRSADDIHISTANGGRLGLKDYIIEVFQQHERDRLRTASKTDAETLQKLNPLGPALIERLDPIVDAIAQHICDGRLNPYALVNLIGDNKVIIHKPNGARSFAVEEDVHKMIDSLLAVMSTREAIKPEEFFANFADPALIQGTLRNNLQAMQGQEKTFFVALFPDEILEQAGMKKKDIIAHRKEAHRFMYNVMTAAVVSVAAMDTEALKKVGLSEKEIGAVQALAEKIEAGDEQAIKTAVDGRDKTALAAIRTAGLNEQVHGIGDGANFWTKMIDKARTVPQMIADRKKQHEEAEKQEPPPPSARERESHRRDTANEAEVGV